MTTENRSLDLDVATPEEVSAILRRAAQQFYETRGELQSAWSDEHAGRVWSEFGKILDRAADACDKAVAKHV